MRILYHHRTLSKDGQAVHIEELIAAFRRAGHEVCVVGPAAHENSDFGSDGGLLTKIRALLPRAVGELIELAYSGLAFIKLWRAYRRFKPDALYERYNLYLLSGAWLRALTGLPYMLEINAPLVLERSRTPVPGLALRNLARLCENSVWRRADVALPVTRVLAGHVVAAGLAESRIEVIPNGIDPAHFPAALSGDAVRARYGLGSRVVIGFTGFMRAWHGVPALIDVMAELQATYDVHFLLVGDGEDREGLLQAAREKGVAERITITGIVPRDQIPAHVAAFDIAMQPKATAYASPLKLFEYMALGRAILAPNQPNLREVLRHEDNALLFAGDDTEDMRAALRRLVTDEGLRTKLGAAARSCIVDCGYTWDGNARRIASAMMALQERVRVSCAPAESQTAP